MMELIKRAARFLGMMIARYAPQPNVSCTHIDVLDLVIRHEMHHVDVDKWFFIQFGAHDGISYDPINRYVRVYHWRGIVVEPQPKVFARLIQTYREEQQLVLENLAIAKNDGLASLFRFKDSAKLPYHASMLTSFSRGALEYNGHGYEGEIEELTVPAMSISTLLSKHNVSHVDLIQIDTEGFDQEIIRMFIEADIWPTIIHFEDGLGLRKANKEFLQPLIDKGYAFFHLYPDTLAYKQQGNEGFRARTATTQEDMNKLSPPELKVAANSTQ
jgi:FkbM family methyltransferase